MRFVSPALKHVVYPAMAGMGWLRRSAPHGVSVVTYHGVQPEGYVPIDAALDGNLVTADNLRRQLRLLKSNYDVITPADFRASLSNAIKLPPRAVLLTCDDGLLNNLTDMLSVLQAEQVRCIFFVTGASAGESPSMLWYERLLLALLRAPAGKFRFAAANVTIEGELTAVRERRSQWWSIVQRLSSQDAAVRDAFLDALRQTSPDALTAVDRVGSAPMQRRFHLLTRQQLLELQRSGMTIGAHTMTHPILSRQSLQLARQEITQSRAALEQVLSQRVWALAYPFGDSSAVDSQTVALAGEAGFEVAFLNYGGGFSGTFDHFAVPRVHVTATMGLAEFEAHVAGFHNFLQRRAGRPGMPVAAAG